MRPGSHPASVAMSICTLALCCALTPPLQARQTQPTQAQQPASREQGAATQRQARKTEQANRAAAVEDETSAAAQAARTAQSETAQFEAAQARRSNAAAGAPSYGPTLTPRGQQGSTSKDPARKDPAEVHDETDSLIRQAPAQPADPAQSQRQTTNPNLRRPAWQPAAEPMAPRPLRAADAASNPADNTVPVAEPVPAAPARAQPSRPAVIGSCQGPSCVDTNGQRYNGVGTGAAGVNSSGRLCVRTGVSVQCF